MTQDEMRSASAAKVQKVTELMKLLKVRVEARQRVDLRTGFMDTTIYWIDDEKYPADEEPKAVGATSAPEVPVEATEVNSENVGA